LGSIFEDVSSSGDEKYFFNRDEERL